ncbi:hypothetical protein BS50DRAFT_593702 [Corynespora cassiicola Philippines]|uniref:Uncharacterized protein n=1 Tax=Corynespora cassiicola Philippines TaxID=1448308 RepID=A0A2T2N5E3_CORCC|nr:hypothetical protein BS50DRAFT_593702 [Corynespora cassiicola Philippines]
MNIHTLLILLNTTTLLTSALSFSSFQTTAWATTPVPHPTHHISASDHALPTEPEPMPVPTLLPGSSYTNLKGRRGQGATDALHKDRCAKCEENVWKCIKRCGPLEGELWGWDSDGPVFLLLFEVEGDVRM